jgi:hypothetical protein
MAHCLRSITRTALTIVLTVHAVPGFAQTNTASSADALNSSTTAARLYVAARGYETDDDIDTPNLAVTSMYQPLIAQMLERSPRFRRQCARLARATNLEITLRSEARSDHHADAWTTIARRADGTRQVTISIVAGPRTIELIAHEFEHVIEQIDGIDLRHKATLRASGVRTCECGHVAMYETDRAIAAGLQVARQVSDGGRGH